ncbi:YbaK/EbsC family protein [Blastococcus sp. Marseille-P5729]|uniref:YbaK/EbsC family protein n=1 Tax=Blastococcus sp. Marseille-P5729 TaxID=2086582 RepID=UPI000D0FC6EF|nr:YbaK/EbsC family protein [Blastococcus sp. Marseille-P5729]
MPVPTPHSLADHPAVSRVRAALGQHGVRPEITYFDESAKTAALAAAQLGIEVGQIANSLVFDAEGEPLLVMTSGAHRVDLGKVAALTGHRRIERAGAAFVKQHTGQAIGGGAPVGHPAPGRTLVDEWLARHEGIWAAAGHAHTVFPTSFEELVRVTGGTPADVGA